MHVEFTVLLLAALVAVVTGINFSIEDGAEDVSTPSEAGGPAANGADKAEERDTRSIAQRLAVEGLKDQDMIDEHLMAKLLQAKRLRAEQAIDSFDKRWFGDLNLKHTDDHLTPAQIREETAMIRAIAEVYKNRLDARLKPKNNK